MVGLVIVRCEKLGRHLTCSCKRGVKYRTVMLGVTLTPEQGLSIKKLVQQKLKIAFVEQHKSESRREES
ncbi:hypothetical protein D3C85_1530150 [compost metagenome]